MLKFKPGTLGTQHLLRCVHLHTASRDKVTSLTAMGQAAGLPTLHVSVNLPQIGQKDLKPN